MTLFLGQVNLIGLKNIDMFTYYKQALCRSDASDIYKFCVPISFNISEECNDWGNQVNFKFPSTLRLSEQDIVYTKAVLFDCGIKLMLFIFE